MLTMLKSYEQFQFVDNQYFKSLFNKMLIIDIPKICNVSYLCDSTIAKLLEIKPTVLIFNKF
jgi:hypothetical protein